MTYAEVSIVFELATLVLTPYRRAFGKRRADLEVFEDPEWEAWEVLSGRQQIRSGTPSRILVTMFATQKRSSDTEVQMLPKMAKTESQTIQNPEVPESNGPVTNNNPSTDNLPPSSNPTNEPSIITHGPKFRQLDTPTQNQIRKIHQNLGHPDNRVLQLALSAMGGPLRAFKVVPIFNVQYVPRAKSQEQPDQAI